MTRNFKYTLPSDEEIVKLYMQAIKLHMPARWIAEQSKSSETTIHNRIRTLRRAGVRLPPLGHARPRVRAIDVSKLNALLDTSDPKKK